MHSIHECIYSIHKTVNPIPDDKTSWNIAK